MANIGSSASLLTISRMLTLSLTILTAAFLSRYLSLAEYGTYSELRVITSLAVSVFALGLPNSINYFIPTIKSSSKPNFITTYFVLINSLSLCIALFLYLFKDYITEYYNNAEIGSYAFFLCTIPWANMCIQSRTNLLIVESKVKREFLYCIANSLCIFSLVVFVVYTNNSFNFFINTYVLIEIVFTILVYYEAYLAAKKKILLSFDRKLIKEIFVFSIPLGISIMVSTIIIDLDKLIIGYFLGEESVAIYANAGKELPFSIIPASITAVVLPSIVKLVKCGDVNKAISLWKNAIEISFIILLFLTLTSIIFAPQIISLLYSDKYLSGVFIFRVYSLVLICRITYWGMFLTAFKLTKQILYNTIYCLILNVLLSIMLFHLIGFSGPAIATVISILALAFLQIYQTSNLLNISMRHMLPWSHLRGDLFHAIVGSAFVYVLMMYLEIGTDFRDIVCTIIIGILWSVIYFSLKFKRIKSIMKEVNATEPNA